MIHILMDKITYHITQIHQNKYSTDQRIKSYQNPQVSSQITGNPLQKTQRNRNNC